MIFVHLLHHFAQLDTSALPNNATTGDAPNSAIATVLNIVFGIVGSVALLIIVISGFRYVLAGGDPNKVATAKKSIVFAVVGLVIALAGFSIVAFVVKGVS